MCGRPQLHELWLCVNGKTFSSVVNVLLKSLIKHNAWVASRVEARHSCDLLVHQVSCRNNSQVTPYKRDVSDNQRISSVITGQRLLRLHTANWCFVLFLIAVTSIFLSLIQLISHYLSANFIIILMYPCNSRHSLCVFLFVWYPASTYFNCTHFKLFHVVLGPHSIYQGD